MRVLCAIHLVRYPLGGHAWHHLQYLVGLRRLGHEVTCFEDWGWPNSCYDPDRDVMTSDPSYGLRFLRRAFEVVGFDGRWCYLAEAGAAYGLSRAELAREARECDLFLNIDGVSWIPELEACRRRALVDVDPVFTQIGAHGLGFAPYDVLFTYGENVHRPSCTMPTGGATWRPTRQPIVLDLWPVTPGDPRAPLTTVLSWNGYGEHEYEGRRFGTKGREFERFLTLPRQAGRPMEVAASAPGDVLARLADAGWKLADPRDVTRTPHAYQAYLARSAGELSAAKHGYVITRSGWFSDRTAAYLASGRPAIVQDTGFSDHLPSGRGLLPFSTREEARAAIAALEADYAGHGRAAREVAAECFDARRVLGELLECAMQTPA